MKPIKPLRLMNSKLLPKKLCNSLLNKIPAIINLIEDPPEIEINQNTIVDKDFIVRSFEHGLKNAKWTVWCMFLKKIGLIVRCHIFPKW